MGAGDFEPEVAEFDDDGRAESLALLVWLSQLSRDGRIRGAVQTDGPELLNEQWIVGRYRLEALLGTGGYGAVFHALDRDSNCYVALKLAWPSILVDPEASQRFVEEPKTMASLAHRGIIEVQDFGTLGMVCFIALELIDGPTLAQWILRHGPMTPAVTADVIRSAAEAIHYAHEQGVIHRDLKPSNILLRAVPGRRAFGYEPVVTDFGLARRPPGIELTLTGTGAIIGTDPYLSPEQATGNAGDAQAASDIFSLGVILYELLAGRRPFEADSAVKTRELILHEPPAALRSVCPGVPRDLETIVLRCLEKAPEQRYATAADLADDLGRYLKHQPIHARRTGLFVRAGKYVRRKPLVVALVSVVIFSLLAVAGLMGAWIADRISASHAIATAEAAERQHRYAGTIRRAGESWRRGARREVIDLLEEARSLSEGRDGNRLELEFLWAQANSAKHTLKASEQSVHVVRFSPRGDVLLSGGEDGRVILWDTETWLKRAEFGDHLGEINTAEICDDGSLLAIGGSDGRVVVHRLIDGAIIYDEPVVGGQVLALAWLGQNEELAVGGQDAILSIINVASKERRRTSVLRSTASDYGQMKEIESLAYARTSGKIIARGAPGDIWVIDPISLEGTQPPMRLGGGLMCSLPIGQGYLAVCGSDKTLHILNLSNGSEVATTPLTDIAESLAFRAASPTLIVGLRNGSMQTFGVEDLSLNRLVVKRSILAHDGRINSLDVSTHEEWIASAGSDGCVRLWKPANCDAFQVPTEGQPWQLEFSPCGRWLVAVDGPRKGRGRVTMFDAKSGKKLWQVERTLVGNQHPDFLFRTVLQIAFDRRGDEFAMMDDDYVVRGRDPHNAAVTMEYALIAGKPLGRIQFSPNNEALIGQNTRMEFTVLDRVSGALRNHNFDESQACCGQFHTALGDLWLDRLPSHECYLRRDFAGPPLVELGTTSEKISAANISLDGRYVAVGAEDRLVYVWDLKRPGLLSKCIGHEGAIIDVCFATDGRTVLSLSVDGTVRFWDIATSSELLKIGSPQERVLSMALSPAGTLLSFGVEMEGRCGLQMHRLGSGRE